MTVLNIQSLPNSGKETAIFEKLISTPLGQMHLAGNQEGLCSARFSEAPIRRGAKSCIMLDRCAKAFNQYFLGKQKTFNIKLILNGTPFQVNVWNALINIPYGFTSAYHEVAARIGRATAVRAAAAACKSNPLAVIVPCHRVVGADGRAVGYAAGLWRKTWLLKHEAAHVHALKASF